MRGTGSSPPASLPWPGTAPPDTGCQIPRRPGDFQSPCGLPFLPKRKSTAAGWASYSRTDCTPCGRWPLLRAPRRSNSRRRTRRDRSSVPPGFRTVPVSPPRPGISTGPGRWAGQATPISYNADRRFPAARSPPGVQDTSLPASRSPRNIPSASA